MASAQIIAREAARKLNVQIANQLTSHGILRNGKLTGKKIEDVESQEWVLWIKELMAIRDENWIKSEA